MTDDWMATRALVYGVPQQREPKNPHPEWAAGKRVEDFLVRRLKGHCRQPLDNPRRSGFVISGQPDGVLISRARNCHCGRLLRVVGSQNRITV
jgi:hypothetical protein